MNSSFIGSEMRIFYSKENFTQIFNKEINYTKTLPKILIKKSICRRKTLFILLKFLYPNKNVKEKPHLSIII